MTKSYPNIRAVSLKSVTNRCAIIIINEFRYLTMLLICLIFTLFLAFQQKAKEKTSLIKQADAQVYAAQNDRG